jgi:hypothetical protein
MHRFFLSVILSGFGILTGFQVNAQTPLPPAANPSPSSPLSVYVIAGSNAVNVLKPPSVVPPTVSVRYLDNRPATGAIVTFSAPRKEPTVKFPNGATSYSVVTDVNGQATIENMTPLGLGGFDIQVYVTYLDEYGSATIRETNYPTLKAASESGTAIRGNRLAVPTEHGLSTAAKVGIISGIAVAAGLGAYFALRGHSTTTVSAGTPTVGAP